MKAVLFTIKSNVGISEARSLADAANSAGASALALCSVEAADPDDAVLAEGSETLLALHAMSDHDSTQQATIGLAVESVMLIKPAAGRLPTPPRDA